MASFVTVLTSLQFGAGSLSDEAFHPVLAPEQYSECAGEKLEVHKKQLKVQKKEKKAKQLDSPAKKKIKQRGIRIRKGVRIKVPAFFLAFATFVCVALTVAHKSHSICRCESPLHHACKPRCAVFTATSTEVAAKGCCHVLPL